MPDTVLLDRSSDSLPRQPNHAPQSIGIAGGGLMGLLLSWQLARRGHTVSLFEAGYFATPAAAAHTAAGMVAPLSEAIAGEPYLYDMGLAALRLWPELLQQLQAESGIAVNYQQNGSLIIAHPQDMAELRQFQRDAARIPLQTPLQMLNQSAISQLEPQLSPQFRQGLLTSDEAHIDNRQLLNTLVSACRQLDVAMHEGCAAEVDRHQIKTAVEQHSFDWVIDCRGHGARPQWQPLRGVRGEVLRLHAPEMSLARPVRLLHPRYQLYVVPKPDHHFVIGATQIESEDRSPMSLQSMLELGSALYTLSPAFAEGRILELNTNLRPALPDNRPQVQLETGLIRINGLFRHGFLLAPVVLTHTLALLESGGLPRSEALLASEGLVEQGPDRPLNPLPFAHILGQPVQGSPADVYLEDEVHDR